MAQAVQLTRGMSEKKMKVPHAKNTFWWFPNGMDSPTSLNGGFDLVAEVDGDDLEDAFELNNHLEKEWTENHGVGFNGLGPHRSASAGDLVEMSDGQMYLARMGEGEASSSSSVMACGDVRSDQKLIV